MAFLHSLTPLICFPICPLRFSQQWCTRLMGGAFDNKYKMKDINGKVAKELERKGFITIEKGVRGISPTCFFIELPCAYGLCR